MLYRYRYTLMLYFKKKCETEKIKRIKEKKKKTTKRKNQQNISIVSTIRQARTGTKEKKLQPDPTTPD